MGERWRRPAIEGDRRYRYYVSRSKEGDAEQPWRIPAGDLEAIVQQAIVSLLHEPVRVSAELGLPYSAGTTLSARCSELAEQALRPAALRALLERLGAKPPSLRTVSRLPSIGDRSRRWSATHRPSRRRSRSGYPCQQHSSGVGMSCGWSTPRRTCGPRIDDRLIQQIASGRAAYRELASGAGLHDAVRHSHLTRLARLQFLAPDIVTTILTGRQPVELTTRTLLRIPELPVGWSEQRQVLGFG